MCSDVVSRKAVKGKWKWGNHILPSVLTYTYIGMTMLVMDRGVGMQRRCVITVGKT